MDFKLSEDLLAMKEAAREFAQKEIADNADQWDEDHYFPIEVVRKMGELGYFGCPIPEVYGGSNVGILAQVLLTEENINRDRITSSQMTRSPRPLRNVDFNG